MLKALLIFLLITNYAAASSYFLRLCQGDESKHSENTKEQIEWLKTILKTNDCFILYNKLQGLKSFNHIIPNKSVQVLRTRQNLLKPEQLKAPNISYPQVRKEWEKVENSFNNLELFREFNFEHIYYENDQKTQKGICEILADVPTLKSISMLPYPLNREDIECIQKNKLNVYLMGPFSNLVPIKDIADRIEGIDDFRWELEGLHHFKNLKFLQIKYNYGNLDLKELASAKKLTNLILNVADLKDFNPISSLKNLNSLSLTCHTESAVITKNFRCGDGAIKDIRFISNLKFLEYLDLSWNDIEDISPIQNLHLLKFLDVRMNKIKSIPESILKRVKHLNTAGNQLSSIDGIEKNKLIEYLNITNNNFQNIEPLKNLNTLRYLSINGGAVQDLNLLKNLDKLRVLNLDSRFPRSSRIHSEMESRQAIEKISQDGDDFQKINEMLFQDSEINELNTENLKNEFMNIESFPMFKNLKVLIVSALTFQGLSKSISNSNIEFLDVSESIKVRTDQYELPRNLIYFQARNTEFSQHLSRSKHMNLKFLDLGRNSDLSIEGYDFPNLELLKLDKSNLEKTPDLKKFKSLKSLQLQDNLLENIQVDYLENLTYLDLSKNLFIETPKFENSKRLETVFLYENKIQSISNVYRKDVDFFYDKNPIPLDEKYCPTSSANSSVRKFCSSR